MTFQDRPKDPGGARVQGSPAAPAEADVAFTRAGTRTATAVPKILYVEDNDDNVYLLRMRFDLLDAYQLLVAEDGETGIAVARAEQPDLILMDLELPVVDGWEATRRLKADPATRAIPIIALSAHALAGARETALAAGCDDFDTKPVEFDRLMAKITAVLGRGA
jgi:CheY-like chemotaxis protein